MKFKRIIGLGLILVISLTSVTAGFAKEATDVETAITESVETVEIEAVADTVGITDEIEPDTEITEEAEIEETENVEYAEEAETDILSTDEESSVETEIVEKTIEEETPEELAETENNITLEETDNIDLASTVTYAVTGGNLTINTSTGAVTDCDTSVTAAVIPSSYSGVTITSIGSSAFYNCSALRSVTIPSTVTTIGREAFRSCIRLTAISIPSSVTEINSGAFRDCISLVSLTINAGGSSKTIDNYAFTGCSALTSVSIPNTVTSLGLSSFSDCTSLTSLSLSEGLTKIGGYSFDSCTSLTSVSIPSTVTEIGIYAFDGCTKLSNLELKEGLTSIGSNAFRSCTTLKSVTIPDSVTEIGSSTFAKCTGLSSLTITNGSTNKTIGNYAFADCTALTKLSIPGTVTSIGTCAFDSCSSLTSLSLSEGITTIGYSSFIGCSKISNLTIPSTVSKIDNYAFKNCTGITSLTMKDGVKSIGYCSFVGCSGLTSVSLPESIDSIDVGAFSGCSSIKTVYIYSNVTSIGGTAFKYCDNLKVVYCYKGSTADNSSLYPSGVTINYLTVPVYPVSFAVVGVLGGRNVTFTSATAGAVIYYSSTTSNITTSDTCVSNGETVLFEDFYGTVYAKAYYNGTWSNVSRLILKIPVANTPTITVSGTKATIKSSTPNAYIYYTTDGTTPTLSNGTNLGLNGGTITVSDDNIIKAIAVRSCFTNSSVATYNMPGVFDGTVAPPSFTVVGTFGGRNVTFTSTTSKAKIYYSSTTSSLTTSDKCISNGETVLFEDFYGTIYARAYYNGKWSNVARLILKIPTINDPTITYENGKATIRTTTPSCYIYYTTDGTTPSITNGTKLCSNSYGQVSIASGKTIKAIAVRSCFTNSNVITATT